MLSRQRHSGPIMDFKFHYVITQIIHPGLAGRCKEGCECRDRPERWFVVRSLGPSAKIPRGAKVGRRRRIGSHGSE